MQKKVETRVGKRGGTTRRGTKRRASRQPKQFNTRLPREECDEICAFLKRHGISKVELIREGYERMKKYYCPKDEPKNKE